MGVEDPCHLSVTCGIKLGTYQCRPVCLRGSRSRGHSWSRPGCGRWTTDKRVSSPIRFGGGAGRGFDRSKWGPSRRYLHSCKGLPARLVLGLTNRLFFGPRVCGMECSLHAAQRRHFPSWPFELCWSGQLRLGFDFHGNGVHWPAVFVAGGRERLVRVRPLSKIPRAPPCHPDRRGIGAATVAHPGGGSCFFEFVEGKLGGVRRNWHCHVKVKAVFVLITCSRCPLRSLG